MGVGPGEALRLSLWQYEALLTEWNRQHEPDGDLDIVTPEQFHESERFFEQNPHLLN